VQAQGATGSVQAAFGKVQAPALDPANYEGTLESNCIFALLCALAVFAAAVMLNFARSLLRKAYESVASQQGPGSLLASALSLVLNVVGADFGTVAAGGAARGGAAKDDVPAEIAKVRVALLDWRVLARARALPVRSRDCVLACTAHAALSAHADRLRDEMLMAAWQRLPLPSGVTTARDFRAAALCRRSRCRAQAHASSRRSSRNAPSSCTATSHRRAARCACSLHGSLACRAARGQGHEPLDIRNLCCTRCWLCTNPLMRASKEL
jgi:hypothetical protein